MLSSSYLIPFGIFWIFCLFYHRAKTDGESDSPESGADSNSPAQSNCHHNNRTKKNSPDSDYSSKIKAYMKDKLSGSSTSVSSSVACSEPSSRGTTPCTLPESKRSSLSRPSRSSAASPYLGSSNSLIVINKDDLMRCDHRLKLFFSMELFQGDREDFNSMLKVK